jgi:hypothetical protein
MIHWDREASVTRSVRIFKAMGSAMAHYGISVPDRQLACVSVESVEGRSYLGAMAAANYA